MGLEITGCVVFLGRAKEIIKEIDSSELIGKYFWIMECGENALEALFRLEAGNVYCETPMLPFDMSLVNACTKEEKQIISDYEELKAWWQNEE